MKKIPGALILGLAMIAVTLLLFFAILSETTIETMHILGLSAILLAEIVTTTYACFTKGSPRRVAAVVFSGVAIPVAIVMSLIFNIAFPESYLVFCLLYSVVLILVNVVAYSLLSFDATASKENQQLQDAKGNMLMLRKMVKCVMADPAAAPYEARLNALEEDLHFSGDNVIASNDASIRQMLLHLQENISNPGFDVEASWRSWKRLSRCVRSWHPRPFNKTKSHGAKLRGIFYSNRISCSVRNTAAQLATDTTIRLLRKKANASATTRPTAPLIILSVAYKMAGKVIAVRQATGT